MVSDAEKESEKKKEEEKIGVQHELQELDNVDNVEDCNNSS